MTHDDTRLCTITEPENAAIKPSGRRGVQNPDRVIVDTTKKKKKEEEEEYVFVSILV